MTVAVNNNTTLTFTQVPAICSGGTFSLPTTSNNSITGTWSPAVNNTSTTTYTFTPDAGQCATTTTMTVAVNNTTTPTFTQVPAICSGGTFTLPTTSNNAITGTWSPAINNTTTTTYTFTPTAGQCATTTTMTVTVNPNVTPTFTQVPAICTGGTFTLPTTSNNAITGTWSPAINNTSTTTYTFTPTAGQCATTTTMTVAVNNNTTPTFTQVSAICSGGTFILPTTSNNAITGTWSPAINNTSTTTYTFTPDAGQCASTTTMTVAVSVVNSPSAGSNSPLCLGSNVQLTASNVTGATYFWTGPNGFTSTSQNPSINNVSTLETGTYNVIAIVNGCSSAANSVDVSIETLPTTISGNDTVCLGETIQIQADASQIPAGAQYFWNFGNAQVLSGSGAGPWVLQVPSEGQYTFVLDSVVNTCKSGPFNFTTTVLAQPSADISASVLTGYAPLSVSFSTPQQNNVQYSWQIDGQMLTGQNQNYVFEKDGDYSVILTANNGRCVAKDTVMIKVTLPDIFIPNAFTPNQDGTNETFTITGLQSMKSFEVSIFDRWGVQLYNNSSDPISFWDGKTKAGKPVTERVYVYVVRFTKPNGYEVIRSGSVTVLR